MPTCLSPADRHFLLKEVSENDIREAKWFYLRVTNEQIEKAKSIDLLSYLQSNEPTNLRHLGRSSYCTRDHDSLKISNGKWFWFSQHIGGYTALDYLIKVRGLSFLEAVERLSGSDYSPPFPTAFHEKEKEFVLPQLNTDIQITKDYLNSRGIDSEIIDWCHEQGIIEEDAKYHNCLFIGFDGNTPRFGAARGTTSNFKRDLSGSDKRYSFRIVGNNQSTLHLFEAAIDLLSYATLEKRAGRDWLSDAMLSLSGVYATEQKQDVPVAVRAYLSKNPQTKTICIHFDNDEVGRLATRQIINALSGKYEVLDCPANSGKDYNDYLQNEIKKEKQRKENVR